MSRAGQSIRYFAGESLFTRASRQVIYSTIFGGRYRNEVTARISWRVAVFQIHGPDLHFRMSAVPIPRADFGRGGQRRALRDPDGGVPRLPGIVRRVHAAAAADGRD